MENIIESRHYLRRDNNNRIRYSHVYLEEEDNIYYIKGCNGLLDGQKVDRPTITIKEGKVKRSPLQQAMLQYNSECKYILDKGYKESFQLDIMEMDLLAYVYGNPVPDSDKAFLEEVESKVPHEITDTKGARKPMLAKSYRDIKKPESFYDKYWYASTKLDGVRCFIYKNENGELVTSSRGGKDYNVAAKWILDDPTVRDLFECYPSLTLDGELYIHGRPLSYISGLCRQKETSEKHKDLKFHCYDYLNESETFQTRKEFLDYIRPFTLDSDKIEIVDQIEVYGWNNIQKLHDDFVSKGYEGLVIRDPEGMYKCGARDLRMIKVKMFEDDEFEITGFEEGLRDEDLVLTLVTKEGYPFKAKPKGDRAMKNWYRDHINEIIGKMGTVQYFHYTTTEHPVPCLPVFKCVRDIKDMDI